MNKILTVLAVVSTSSLLASTTPNIGSVIQETKIEKPQLIQKSLPPKIKAKQIKAPLQTLGGATVKVKKFIFSNNESINSEELRTVIKEYFNQELNLSQLKEVAYKITQYYRARGYFVARAYLPQQDVKDNTIEIAVLEGKYGTFNIKNSSHVGDKVLQRHFSQLKDEKAINTDSLERVILNINSLPGATIIKSDIKAGQTTGLSDFDIIVEPTKQVGTFVMLDNFGSRYTEEERIVGGVDINSPFKLGDKIYFEGILSNKEALQSAKIEYEYPLNSNGLKSKFSYNYTEYSLEKEYKSLDATGDSKTFEATLSYPFIKQRESEYTVSATYKDSSYDDDIESTSSYTSKDLNSVLLGFSGYSLTKLFGFNSQVNVSASYTHGYLDIISDDARTQDASGAQSHGHFDKINLQLSSMSALNEKFSLSNTLKLQKALGHKNLDGSEDFYVGGSSGVKAYPSSEVSGENGYLLSSELFYKMPEFNSTLSAFFDIGKAKMENSISSYDSKTIYDVGIGYYFNYKNMSLKSYLAKAVNSYSTLDSENQDISKPKLLVQFTMVF